MASRWPRVESESEEILHAARRTLRHRADQRLTAALDSFVRLRRFLVDQEEEERLRPAEQAVLRNCLLAEADVLREMSQFEDAASAYRTVELRFMNQPPALEAILGRAACAKQMGKQQEAEMLIRQASVVLDRIPTEMDNLFAETTRFDRDGWNEFLGWMNQRLETEGA